MVRRPQAKKPIALRMATELESPNSCVPTGIAKTLPANPVIACTVYAKKNAAIKRAFSIVSMFH